MSKCLWKRSNNGKIFLVIDFNFSLRLNRWYDVNKKPSNENKVHVDVKQSRIWFWNCGNFYYSFNFLPRVSAYHLGGSKGITLSLSNFKCFLLRWLYYILSNCCLFYSFVVRTSLKNFKSNRKSIDVLAWIKVRTFGFI